jgi:hypothetical protein
MAEIKRSSTSSIVVTPDGVVHMRFGPALVQLPAHEFADFVGRSLEALDIVQRHIGVKIAPRRTH